VPADEESPFELLESDELEPELEELESDEVPELAWELEPDVPELERLSFL
jgi:hypothetical protein